MPIPTLLLAGALTFGQGLAVDQQPFNASRSDAIREAARDEAAVPAPTTTARYPSADGDILADLNPAMTIPPLKPAHPIAAKFPPQTAPSAGGFATDTSGLLGGPKP